MTVSNRMKAGAAGVACLVLVAVLMFFSMIRRGFSAADEPSTLEAMMASRMRAWSVPADLRDMKNPVTLTPEILAGGKSHWADHCATCHGNDGRGSDMGKKMYPRAPDMTDPDTQQQSDGALFATIENGIRLTGMPAFGDGTAGSAEGSWSLVHFIRQLPKLTEADLEEMKKMNPVSPMEMMASSDEEAFLDGGEAADAVPVKSHH